MNKYIVTVYSVVNKDKKAKDINPEDPQDVKIKNIVCNDDSSMFAAVQQAMNSGFTYEVHKAELTLVLHNKEITSA